MGLSGEAADVALVGTDPRYRGGALTMMEASWQALTELGRAPRLHYVEHPGLAGRSASDSPLHGPGAHVGPRHVEALRLLRGAGALAPSVRAARTVWVVATSAHSGLPAARSGRPYGCWLATGLRDEWAGRLAGLPLSRRVALRANAPLLLRFEREVLRRASVVFALSEWTRDRLAEAAVVDRDAIRVVPAPVDASRFTPLPDDEWLARLAEPLLVFVGRANDPRKNAGLLLEAFTRMRTKLPVRLRIVGEPPASPLPDGVEAVGETRDVGRLVRDAHLLVVPSTQEGFGIVVAEALAAGVPVLSTPCGGPEHAIRESGAGRVLSGFDADELGEAAVAMLESRPELEEMRRRGREYVARVHAPAAFRAALADALRLLDDGAR